VSFYQAKQAKVRAAGSDRDQRIPSFLRCNEVPS
jgi:hypothetical protein